MIVNHGRPLPFSGGRKPTPRSIRIVSMQDANVASATTPTGTGSDSRAGSGGHREPGTDRTTRTTQVSSSAGAPPLSRFPFYSSFFSRSHVLWSRAAKASVIGALLPTLFSFPQTQDARLRAAKVLISELAHRTPARPVLENTLRFLFRFLFSHTSHFRRSSTLTLFTSSLSEYSTHDLYRAGGRWLRHCVVFF